MARTRKPTGENASSSNGKERVESSKGSKRARNDSIIESSDEEDSNYDPMREDNQVDEEVDEQESEDEQEEGDKGLKLVIQADGLPRWQKPRRLSEFPEEYQARMYMRKVNKSKQALTKRFLCEKAIKIDEFRPFGVLECFKRLGWNDFLEFKGVDEIYNDQILEWMSTLQQDEGSKPPTTTQLIGYVGEKRVILSFAELKKLAKYDYKPTITGSYTYPPNKDIEASKADEEKWKIWIQSMFIVPHGTDIPTWSLHRDNLRAFPRLLLWFLTTNVMPRTSDLDSVRLFEVMILYALMTGSIKLSARHLIMYNIWEARERKERLMIPHARLLSKMLLRQGAIPEGVMGLKVKRAPVQIKHFVRASSWEYENLRVTHRLKLRGTNKFVEGPRSDGEEEGEEEVNAGGDASTPPVNGPVVTGIPPTMHGTPYYAYIYETMSQARPDEFVDWPHNLQLIFDRQSQQIAEQRAFQHSMIYRHEQPRDQGWQHQGSSSSSFAGSYDIATIQKNVWELTFGPSLDPPPHGD